jgi:DNA adenine methylase Dam
MGNKYKLLKHLIPLFPKQCNTFYDLFGGSGCVSINYRGGYNIIYNEFNHNIVKLQQMIKSENIEQLDSYYKDIIKRYDLRTQSNKKDSKKNEQGYLKLRDEYNKSTDRDIRILYLLICYSINHLIRFNTNSEFNVSDGNDAYNDIVKNRLVNHHNSLQDTTIWNKNVFDIDYSLITQDDFVYLDPPYSNTQAVYNEKRAFGGWTVESDYRLFDIIDSLNKRNVRFGMSNVFVCRGKQNNHLIDWCTENKYIVYHFNRNYNPFSRGNSNNDEVYITNYQSKQPQQLTLF